MISVGDKVEVIGSSFYTVQGNDTGFYKSRDMVGHFCIVKEVHCYTNGDLHSFEVWNTDQSDWWYFKPEDLKAMDPTKDIPKTEAEAW